MEATLKELETRARERIAAAATAAELEAVRVEVLGRKGALAQISRQLGALAPEERAPAGKRLNAVKAELEQLMASRQAQFEQEALRGRLDAEWIDLTLPPYSLDSLLASVRSLAEAAQPVHA